MLKIRLQGTVKDIRWFKRLLERHPEIRVLSESEIFSNMWSNQYFRSYAEVEKKKKKGERGRGEPPGGPAASAWFSPAEMFFSFLFHAPSAIRQFPETP